MYWNAEVCNASQISWNTMQYNAINCKCDAMHQIMDWVYCFGLVSHLGSLSVSGLHRMRTTKLYSIWRISTDASAQYSIELYSHKIYKSVVCLYWCRQIFLSERNWTCIFLIYCICCILEFWSVDCLYVYRQLFCNQGGLELNIKQSGPVMRALTRPNGHAGVDPLYILHHRRWNCRWSWEQWSFAKQGFSQQFGEHWSIVYEVYYNLFGKAYLNCRGARILRRMYPFIFCCMFVGKWVWCKTGTGVV